MLEITYLHWNRSDCCGLRMKTLHFPNGEMTEAARLIENLLVRSVSKHVSLVDKSFLLLLRSAL